MFSGRATLHLKHARRVAKLLTPHAGHSQSPGRGAEPACGFDAPHDRHAPRFAKLCILHFGQFQSPGLKAAGGFAPAAAAAGGASAAATAAAGFAPPQLLHTPLRRKLWKRHVGHSQSPGRAVAAPDPAAAMPPPLPTTAGRCCAGRAKLQATQKATSPGFSRLHDGQDHAAAAPPSAAASPPAAAGEALGRACEQFLHVMRLPKLLKPHEGHAQSPGRTEPLCHRIAPTHVAAWAAPTPLQPKKAIVRGCCC